MLPGGTSAGMMESMIEMGEFLVEYSEDPRIIYLDSLNLLWQALAAMVSRPSALKALENMSPARSFGSSNPLSLIPNSRTDQNFPSTVFHDERSPPAATGS